MEQISSQRILQELAVIGFSDAADFIQVRDGKLVLTPTEQLTPEQRKVIAGYKETKYGVEMKLHDKVQALQLLGRCLGLFSTKPEQQSPELDDSFLDALRGQATEAWEEGEE